MQRNANITTLIILARNTIDQGANNKQLASPDTFASQGHSVQTQHTTASHMNMFFLFYLIACPPPSINCPNLCPNKCCRCQKWCGVVGQRCQRLCVNTCWWRQMEKHILAFFKRSPGTQRYKDWRFSISLITYTKIISVSWWYFTVLSTLHLKK